MIERQGNVEHDPLHETAAEWFARLQERDISLEETLEWQRWMAADPRHAAAFARIEEVWEQPWHLLPARGRPQRQFAVLAIAASLLVITLALQWTSLGGGSLLQRGGQTEVIQTRIGQSRSVQLSDGSRIILGGGTQLRVSLEARVRRIDLLRGEALFTVAKDRLRPFTVHAGDASVTAVGTEFNVRRSRERVVVAVMEGRVTIEPKLPLVPQWLREPAAKRRPIPLSAGEQTVVGSEGVESATRVADIATATAWQAGRLVFRSEPLRYVIEDVNRYSLKPVVLEDESIGDIRITGTVLGGSVGGWIASLENAFALRAVEGPERIVLTRLQGGDG